MQCPVRTNIVGIRLTLLFYYSSFVLGVFTSIWTFAILLNSLFTSFDNFGLLSSIIFSSLTLLSFLLYWFFQHRNWSLHEVYSTSWIAVLFLTLLCVASTSLYITCFLSESKDLFIDFPDFEKNDAIKDAIKLNSTGIFYIIINACMFGASIFFAIFKYLVTTRSHKDAK